MHKNKTEREGRKETEIKEIRNNGENERLDKRKEDKGRVE